jgi:hypothetical protein
MIYKFKSPAAGDVIMLAPQGDQLLRLLGREPAAQGVFEPADMPALVQSLQAAIASAEAPPADAEGDGPTPTVGLRQRLWPMVEMLRRAQAADARIVWGV